MKLELNQEAASNFNVKAEVLLAELTQDPYADQPQPKPPQDPGIYVHEFPKDAILEVMINSYAEADGRTNDISDYA